TCALPISCAGSVHRFPSLLESLRRGREAGRAPRRAPSRVSVYATTRLSLQEFFAPNRVLTCDLNYRSRPKTTGRRMWRSDGKPRIRGTDPPGIGCLFI